MTLLSHFTIDDAIRAELHNYDHVKSLLIEHDETSVHHPYLVGELVSSKNNLMDFGFYLLEWN